MQNRTEPTAVPITRAHLRRLAEQLAIEYAGAVAPGQVMSLVFTTGRRLQRRGLDPEALLQLTKSSVRSRLTTVIGAAIAHGRSSEAAYPSNAGDLRLARA
ncbi:hypothetical protein ACI2LF_12380 [Kribbella sp. NPDC020789]